MISTKPKLLFVYPDFESLGIEYLMALCKERGFETELLFYFANDPYTLFNKQSDYKKLAETIIKIGPNVVCFSAVTDNYRFQTQIAKLLKTIDKDIIIVFGGVHVTSVPETVIMNDFVDAICIGEGEVAFIEFLESLRFEHEKISMPDRSINGIVFKKENQLFGTFEEGCLTDLNTLPFPYKDAFYKAFPAFQREYTIMSARGCPLYCSYCINSLLKKMRKGQNFRQRSVANVIKELIYAKKQYGFKFVNFLDDTFTADKLWIKDFLKEYKKYIDIPFLCSVNHLFIDEEIISLLKNAKCWDIQMGVQSFSKDICVDVLNRKIDYEKLIEIVKIIKNNGILLQLDHLLGIPNDNIKNQEENVLVYNENRPDIVSVFWLTYYPKTPIVKYAFERGILNHSDIQKIEQGKYISNLHVGSFEKTDKALYGISFLLNYLPFLPKFLVKFLIKSKIYKFFRIKSYFITTAIPRFIISIIDKKYFTGRTHIIRFLYRIFR